MDEQTKKDILTLLKLDLGITHNLRDTYFEKRIESSETELENMGIVFDFSLARDQMFVSDFTAWKYRKRLENIPLARNLQIEINSRLIKKAGTVDAVT